KGVKIMLHRHFDELIQDETGRVIGVVASYSKRDDIDPNQTSYYTNGNIDETREVIRIRARKAVVLGTGGHVGNPQVRSMFYPGMREPAWGPSGQAIIGPRAADASG